MVGTIQWHGPGLYLVCVGEPGKSPRYRKHALLYGKQDAIDIAQDLAEEHGEEGFSIWSYFLGRKEKHV